MVIPAGPASVRAADPAARDRLGRLLAGAGLAAAGTVLVAVVDPDQPGHYPLCPFRALTGLACPGCGGLRAVHALTRGDLPAALGHNALLVLLLPAVVAVWAAAVRRAVKHLPALPRPGPLLVLLATVAVLSFTVARNLPGVGFLGP